MKAYLDIVQNILENGVEKGDRTGTGTLSVFGVKFEHDMEKGFPAVTTKKIFFRSLLVELEFFIKGYTDKRWLQERKCTIWDEWANPQKTPYGHDLESLVKMKDESDLGPIYGFQWRHYGANYEGVFSDYEGKGVDQLKEVIKLIKNKPDDRRMIVTAWNPMQMDQMALPACHYGFQCYVGDGKLNLAWNQRSVDTMLGLPFNIASYAMLLHLIAKETNLKEGKLVGFLGDT
ncbi:MAG: thymidylate synthase, partial [Nanoarchaeota archaeon]